MLPFHKYENHEKVCESSNVGGKIMRNYLVSCDS